MILLLFLSNLQLIFEIIVNRNHRCCKRRPRLNQNAEPKLDQNAEPKLDQNAEPKLDQNAEPKAVRNR